MVDVREPGCRVGERKDQDNTGLLPGKEPDSWTELEGEPQ